MNNKTIISSIDGKKEYIETILCTFPKDRIISFFRNGIKINFIWKE